MRQIPTIVLAIAATLAALGLLTAACSSSPSSPADGCSVAADCDDGNPCSDDVCSAEGKCEWRANAAPCDDNNSCTDGDMCVNAVCRGGTNVCPCTDDSDCTGFEDGDQCNGTLVCNTDTGCIVDDTTVVECATNQDTTCEKNTCAPATGACSLTAVDAPECTDTCPVVAKVDESPLPVQSSANTVESTSVNGFSDDYVYNQAGTLKIGTRRDWGGSIVFFGQGNGSPGVNTSNTIDSADTGREVQIALYDVDRWYQSCAHNASCNATPSPTICPQTMTWLGWNPVQGGNRCNNGSGIDDVSMGNGAVNVTTTPLMWNPHWQRTDCNSDACDNPAVNMLRSDVEVKQRVRFVRPNVVELSYELNNLAALDHPISAHEFPTVYTSFGRSGTPDLHRLFNSSQQEVAIDAYPPNDQTFRYKNFTSSGGWVSFQNNSLDYGVALYYENGMDWFQAWQADDPDFNNFRGLFSFGIGPFAQVRARSYLILGSLATVAAEALWLTNNLPPFGSLDGPVVDDTVSGTVSVFGWAMDNKGVSSVELIVDGGAPIPLSYGNSRPDVCLVWPGYPSCSDGNVGYSGSFDANTLTPAQCGNVLEIRATDTDGNSRIIARRRVYLTTL